jgi:hypothetical protein
MSWILRPVSEFSAHSQAWQQLNKDNGASPLLETEFVQPLLDQFASERELLACYERQGQVLAMAIVTPRGRGVWYTFQPSQQPVSLWLSGAGMDIAALSGELLRALPGLAVMLSIVQRDPYLSPRPVPAPTIDTSDYIRTAKISVEGSFDDYWNARGKNLRSNLRKQRTKLTRDGIVTRLEVSRAPEQMAAAIADYGRLESAGWKAKNGTAVHADNDQGRFYRAMLEGFGRRDAACVFRYWFNDELMSMNLCIEGDGALIVLKTTYQESLNGHFSPSFLMREDTCQRLFEERKFNRLEFYGKVMEWHSRWTDESRQMYHLTSYRWPFLKGLYGVWARRHALLDRLRRAPAPQPTPVTAEQ